MSPGLIEPLVKWFAIAIMASAGCYFYIRSLRSGDRRRLKEMKEGDNAQERQIFAHQSSRGRDLLADAKLRRRLQKSNSAK